VWGLLSASPASFSVAGAFVPLLLELREGLLAAGGDEIAVRDSLDDDDDGGRFRPRLTKKVRLQLPGSSTNGAESDADEDVDGDEADGSRRSRSAMAARRSPAWPLRDTFRTVEAVLAAGIRSMGVELFTRLAPFSDGQVSAPPFSAAEGCT
jgi:hypothetical protein